MTRLDHGRGDAAVVLVAAGAGVRLGGGTPKALRWLAGEPLVVHAARRVLAADCVGCLVVVAPAGHESTVTQLVEPLIAGACQLTVVVGGAQRQDSVAAGLAVVPAEFDIVLVHDAARALTPANQIDDVAAAVRAGHAAVVPVLPVVDTVVEVAPDDRLVRQVDRSVLRAVQTPQGFQREVLLKAHRNAPAGGGATDDAGLVARLGVPVQTIPGSGYALKITTRHDLMVAEALLAGAD